jgi:phosphoglycerol transferase
MKPIVRGLAPYAAAAALAVLLAAFALRLWRADLHAPMHYSWDSLPHLAWVKGVAEHGWFLSNPSLGAPFALDMCDFPLLDNLHFLVVKVLALCSSDPAVLVNLFFLLTFPPTTLTTLWTLRRFGVGAGPALVCSLLYAFTPYHFFRGQAHLFLSAYHLVPLVVGVALDVALDRGVLLFSSPSGRARWNFRSPRTWAALLVCSLMGGGGAYYAFFGLFFLFVAGLLAATRLRTPHPLVAATILGGLLLLGCVANAAPSLLAWHANGGNPETARRQVREADAYGLRLTALFMPVEGHYLPALRRLADRYQAEVARPVNHRGAANLGIVGCCGFVFLLGWLLPRRSGEAPLLDALARLNLCALLLGLAGGAGGLLGFSFTPLIRCYNRISICIAFFSLFAVALLLDRLSRLSIPRPLVAGLLSVVLAVGFLDQTGHGAAPDHASLRREYRRDAAYFARLQEEVPTGTMIFQLPYMPFPESPPAGRIACSYEHLRGYLHTRGLRWSFAAMRGTYGDAWQARLAEQPAGELLDSLALAGFGGLLLDRQGVRAGLEDEVKGVLEREPLESADDRLAFYDLSGHRDRLRQGVSPECWRWRSEAVLRPVLPTWQGEVGGEERTAGGRVRWVGSRAALMLHNPSGQAQRVRLTLALLPPPGGWRHRQIEIRGKGLNVTHTLRREEVAVDLLVEVPPGRRVLHFKARGTAHWRPEPPRRVVFGVRDLVVSPCFRVSAQPEQPARVAGTRR